jgi:hypothetical protein
MLEVAVGALPWLSFTSAPPGLQIEAHFLELGVVPFVACRGNAEVCFCHFPRHAGLLANRVDARVENSVTRQAAAASISLYINRRRLPRSG